MSSIIEGYNYDIFISYRQKDNKGDRWVSEFVDSLKTELESTFKEEISVYFDINPHDGLLETHDVDESLKEKLKCLVFIPIISRTYCDPKSFAWEHEFKAFVEQSSKDSIGFKVKLPGGNVARRVLPVQIHDLDADDKKLVENELGGFIRGIEFIYKESGVNRPLTTKDNEEKNLNKTSYRNQINKVALAVKEIIYGMRSGNGSIAKEVELSDRSIKDQKSNGLSLLRQFIRSKRLIVSLFIAALIVVAAILFSPRILKSGLLNKSKLPSPKISLAVMPFQNMTGDINWNNWQEAIQTNLISHLVNNNEFELRRPESINSLLQNKGITDYASITPSVAKTISQNLEVQFLVCGNIQKAGSKLRLNSWIIDNDREEIIKSFTIDGLFIENLILNISDSLGKTVTDFLIIYKLKRDNISDLQPFEPTNNPDAYSCYLLGMDAYSKRNYPKASSFFDNSLKIDSNFIYPAIMLTQTLVKLSDYYKGGGRIAFDNANKVCMKIVKKIDQMPMRQKIYVNYVKMLCYGSPNEEINCLKDYLKLDKEWPVIYFNLGEAYWKLEQYDKAIPEYEKALELCKRKNSKPLDVYSYTYLGEAYHKTGQFRKERQLYNEAEQDYPDDYRLLMPQAVLFLAVKDTVSANRYIKKLISVTGVEWNAANRLGMVYAEAKMPDKAEYYFRRAFKLAPARPWTSYALAKFLIDYDRNINEGLELIDKLLKEDPDNWYHLDVRGLGLYKQGKYKEALEIFQRVWKLKTTYQNSFYVHLQATRIAAAEQK